MDEELQDKIDGYNEMLLRNTALTFSSEGVSADIKSLLSRKAVFVNEMLMGFANIIEASSHRKQSAARTKLFDAMLAHALEEVHAVNSAMNFVISRVLEREESLMVAVQEKNKKPEEKKPDEKPGTESPKKKTKGGK